jgi:AraC-like DNA-binding protein
MIEFHGVIRGSCWGAVVGHPPVRVDEGDVILFPQGDPHVMSSAPGMRASHVDKGFYFTPRPPQLPFSLTLNGERVSTARLDGGRGECVTVVCGFLGCDARPFNPLLTALPRVLRVSSATLGPDSWVRQFLRSAVAESSQQRPGGEAVLELMSKMMFVEVLRRYIESLPAEETGWFAGMRDPVVGRALALLHERPGQRWTLETLGEAVGLSRSSLHERFTHFVGQPPMQYLGQWRMQLAAGLLRDSNARLIDVALETGYESEAALSRAFKRHVGMSPRAWKTTRDETSKTRS